MGKKVKNGRYTNTVYTLILVVMREGVSRDYIYNKLDEKDFKKFIKENLKFKKKFKDTIRSKFSDEDIERLKGKLKK